MTQSNFKGKNAIITGASKGIGKAVAMRLAENGINVAIAARTKGSLEAAVEEIKSKTGVKVIGVVADVAKMTDLENLVNTAMKEFGHIDILVNNAGVSSQYLFEKQPIEEFEKLVYTNYLGYVRMIKLLIDHL